MKNYGIEYDEAKRLKTLKERGIDFDDAGSIFEGDVLNREDDRNDYGETRLQTLGKLHDVTVVVVWTMRGENRRIISMRRANERERKKYEERMDRS